MLIIRGIREPQFYEFQEVADLARVQLVIRQQVEDVVNVPIPTLSTEVATPLNPTGQGFQLCGEVFVYQVLSAWCICPINTSPP